MTKRKVSNPLALAVLACLDERPMHPYEMASTMRERGKDQSIKLNYGSLYTVVEALQQHGLIAAQETEREGRRPERTIYRLTDAGRMELLDWMSELISTPVKEYTSFEAGLTLLAVLAPEDAAVFLQQRCRHLEVQIAQGRTMQDLMQQHGLPRLVMIEHEYLQAMRAAELAWARQFADEIASGRFEGLAEWQAFQDAAATADHAPSAGRDTSDKSTVEREANASEEGAHDETESDETESGETENGETESGETNDNEQ